MPAPAAAVLLLKSKAGKKAIKYSIGAVVALVALIAAMLSLTVFGSVAGAGCQPAPGTAGTPGAPGTGAALGGNQTAYVQIIIGIAKTLGIPEQGWIVALATALQESSLMNTANPVVPASLSLPNDGSSSDHDSIGLFQQRPSTGWGTPAQIMSPAYSAEAFFGGQPIGGTTNRGLLEVPGWQLMPITVVAQTVQGSALPTAYAKWQGEATSLAAANAAAPAVPLPLPAGYNQANPGSPAGAPSPGGTNGVGGSCPAPGQPQTVAATPGVYYDPLRGIVGLTPRRIDQGVDFAGSGPIYALGDGVVLSTTNSGWPGGAFIAIRLVDGPATNAVVYTAENITVTPGLTVGQTVTPNTVIGTLHDAYPYMEIGWGAPDALGTSLSQGYGGFHDGVSPALGLNFSQLLVKLGAPAGVPAPPIGTLPAGWPTW